MVPSVSLSPLILVYYRMEDPDKPLSVDSVPDIFNSSRLLARPVYQTEKRYQFLVDAADKGSERCQIVAARFMLQYYNLFPKLHEKAARVAFSLMNVNEENLRLTLLKDLHVIGIDGGYTKQVIELYLQCTMSNIEEERILAYDGLVRFLHNHWIEVATAVRELLNREHSAKNRKMVLEFVNDRMRIASLSMLKNMEVLDLLENIFKEEFKRANLSYIDSLFMYLGNSFLMDNFERQQSIAKHFADTILAPPSLPEYLDEPVTTTAKAHHSINSELDGILVSMTILNQMTTILRDKSDTINDWFIFVVDNMQGFFDLPFERECRALRAFAQFTVCCSNTVSDDHIDKLFDIIQDLVPSTDPDSDPANLPKVNLHRLECCCIALYNLRHIPSVREKMDRDETPSGKEFRKRIRFLVRYCHIKSTEYKTTVEELGDIPLRKEMNALVAAATTVGLIIIEILKPSETWELKPRPSWKSCWVTRPIPRNPKKIKNPVKLPATVITI